ncbi:MAG: hypothetical protein WC683_10680 [bacterium]
MSMMSFRPVSVTLPSGVFPGEFRFISNCGPGENGAAARTGLLMIKGQERMVRTLSGALDCSFMKKRFDTLKLLERLGFKVVPFYGMMELDSRPLFFLHDLREGKRIELYDEEYICNNQRVRNPIGKKIIRSNAQEVFNNLTNANQVNLQMMRTHLLQDAYDIYFGALVRGNPHTITRDPRTNEGDVFVTDVSEFRMFKNEYNSAIDPEDAVRLPDVQIASAFSALLANFHPAMSAEELLNRFREENALKADFMEAAFKAVVGISFHKGEPFVPSTNAEWARRIFPKNTFSDVMMQSKLHLANVAKSFEYYTGMKLFDVTRQARDRFISGADLMLGVDFAYMAALDNRVMYIDALRKSVDAKGPLPQQDDRIAFAEDGFPAMLFFERFDEPINERHVVQIKGEDGHVLDVEFDWETAMRVEAGGYLPHVEPGQIKGLSLNGRPVRGFDAAKVKIRKRTIQLPPPPPIDKLSYSYEGKRIYRK